MKRSMIIHPEELSQTWIDKLADAGIDTLGIHPRGGVQAIESLHELVSLAKTVEYRKLIDYAHSRGLAVEYEIHAAGYLMPREWFAEHPEYFRMDDTGNRTNDWNFCVSNPEALDRFAKHAAELALALYGSSPFFYFWMDDGYDFHCKCPKCQALSPSDQQLIAVNRMLREIQKQIPNARMAYLAYMDGLIPPTHVSPEKGVFLEYAPFEKYTAKGEDAPERIARERKMIEPLMRVFDKEPKKVLEYWYDNSLYSKWKKPPVRFSLNEQALQKDVAEYEQMGFDYLSTFACFLGADYEALYGGIDITPFSRCSDRSE